MAHESFKAASEYGPRVQWERQLSKCEEALRSAKDYNSESEVTALGKLVEDAEQCRAWLMEVEKLAALSTRHALRSIKGSLDNSSKGSLVQQHGPSAYFAIVDSCFQQNPAHWVDSRGEGGIPYEHTKNQFLREACINWLVGKADALKEKSPELALSAARKMEITIQFDGQKENYSAAQQLMADVMMEIAPKLKGYEPIAAAGFAAQWGEAELQEKAFTFLMQRAENAQASDPGNALYAADLIVRNRKKGHADIEKACGLGLAATKKLAGTPAIPFNEEVPRSFYPLALAATDKEPFAVFTLAEAKKNMEAATKIKGRADRDGVYHYCFALESLLQPGDSRALEALEALLNYAEVKVEEFPARIAKEKAPKFTGENSELHNRAKKLHAEIIEAHQPSRLTTAAFMAAQKPREGKKGLNLASLLPAPAPV